MFPEKPYKRNTIYTVRIKSLDQIKALGGLVRNNSDFDKRLSLVHSNGIGGGLSLTYKFIDEYFGTQKDMEVTFIRTAGETCSNREVRRYIFQTHHRTGVAKYSKDYSQFLETPLYGEWFIRPESFNLPAELFEL